MAFSKRPSRCGHRSKYASEFTRNIERADIAT